ncbi:MAG: hypothetical protein AAFP90_12055, partial [Planctomycetota bacterium]
MDQSSDNSASPAPAAWNLVTVPLEQDGYQILIGSGRWSKIASTVLSRVHSVSHVMIVADQAIARDWADPLCASFRQHADVSGQADSTQANSTDGSIHRLRRVDLLTIPSGESSKSIDQLSRLWQWMLQCGADRQSLLIALGGGVVGDLAGFAAA